MARETRIETQGNIYHVIARGNNREYIFKDDLDKGYLIKLIKDIKSGMGFKLYGYVLMDNHYHFIIQPIEKRLQDVMHCINLRYSKYFNLKYKRIGHVFQGRYKSISVQDERYLLSLLRYIHKNPIRAGLCKNIEGYSWSSDFFYRKNIKSFVDTETVLYMLSENADNAIEQYCQLMLIEETDEKSKFEDSKFIGDEAFQMLMSTRENIEQRKRLDEILISTGVTTEEYNLIKAGSRKRSLTSYKYEYIKTAVQLCYTHKEIGTNISITDASVRDIMKAYDEKNKSS